MSTEIRSLDGRLLYTAENGADVHAAVIEAARNGANLCEANLYEANLYRADLRGADLRRANLCGTNLYKADLYGADLNGADLRSANLYKANLRRANLRRANLRWADLRGADLCGADLRRANLNGAYLNGACLNGANLIEADLYGAIGVARELTSDLMMLLDQVGKIRAYKLVNANGEGHIYGGIKYEIGKTVEVVDANTNPDVDCGVGIHVATLAWCLRDWRPGYKILIVEFGPDDIAAIPASGDGKFRLHRCKVIKEKEIDTVALGLTQEEAVAA